MKRAAILPQGRKELSPECGDGARPGVGPDGATSGAKGLLGKTAPSRLWFWFIAAFCVQVAAWVAWLVIAAHHRVQEIPLVP
jgi:hypothetical protein